MADLEFYANGCSMTYGQELVDAETHPERHLRRWQLSWPGQLGLRMGASRVTNEAMPGGSNDRIVRVTTEWLARRRRLGGSTSPCFVVIGWTSPMRREFLVDDEWRQLIPYHEYADGALNSLARVYREVAWDEREGAARFGLQVVMLQTLLRSWGYPYLFFDALPASVELVHAGPSDTFSEIDQSQYLDFALPEAAFSNYARQMSNGLVQVHPSAAAHAAFADRLADELRSRHALGSAGAQGLELDGTGDFTIRDRKVGLPRRPPRRRRRLGRIDRSFIYD